MSQGSGQADTIRQEFEGSPHRNVFLLGSQVKGCTVPWLAALPTYLIDEVPDFIRIGWSGAILGHAQVAGSHIISNHFRSGIQAPMQLAQVEVLERRAETWQQVKKKWVQDGACLLHGIAGCVTGKPKTALCVLFTSTCPKAYEMSISKIQSLLTYTERKTTWGFYECKLPCLVHFTGHDYWIIIAW